MANFIPTRMVFLAILHLNTDPNYRGECPVCYEETENATRTSCGHIFCWECITKWTRSSDSCPMCRTKLWNDDIFPGQLLALATPPPAPALPAVAAQPAAVPAPWTALMQAPPAPPAPARIPALIPAAAAAPPAQAVVPPALHEVIVVDDDDEDDEYAWILDPNEYYDPRDDDPNDEDYVP